MYMYICESACMHVCICNYGVGCSILLKVNSLRYHSILTWGTKGCDHDLLSLDSQTQQFLSAFHSSSVEPHSSHLQQHILSMTDHLYAITQHTFINIKIFQNYNPRYNTTFLCPIICVLKQSVCALWRVTDETVPASLSGCLPAYPGSQMCWDNHYDQHCRKKKSHMNLYTDCKNEHLKYLTLCTQRARHIYVPT